jgi:hypothetical protein
LKYSRLGPTPRRRIPRPSTITDMAGSLWMAK